MKSGLDSVRLTTIILKLLFGFLPALAIAQTLGGAATLEISWWRIGSALLLCLILAIVAVFVLKARNGHVLKLPGRQPLRMRVVEVLRLNPKTRLYLVEVDHSTLVLSQDNTGTRLLKTSDSGSKDAEPLV